MTFEWTEGKRGSRAYGKGVKHEDERDIYVDSSLASRVSVLTCDGEHLACVGLHEFLQNFNGSLLQLHCLSGETLV